jgi:hypothetical protein
MNQKQQTVTIESLDITIARLARWTEIEWYEDNAGPGFWSGRPPPEIGLDSKGEWTIKEQKRQHVPSFSTSYDALRSLEKDLTSEEQRCMIDHLCKIVTRDAGPMTAITKAFFAAPEQRAEAWILTKTKCL